MDSKEHRSPARSRLAKLGFLVFGLGIAVALHELGPREQHVRIVLGDAAPKVHAVEIRYVAADGEVAREARLNYAPGAAPRVVSHEPRLPDGAYRLDVAVDVGPRRLLVPRQVTLGGGSTQIDLSATLLRDSP